MSLRDVVTGGGCSAGAGGSNNPLAALADKLTGSSSKGAAGLRDGIGASGGGGVRTRAHPGASPAPS